MATIEVDFDVYKELTSRRETEAVTYNDVIRRLLKLSVPAEPAERSTRKAAFMSKGVSFPDGTELQVNYKGRLYTARIENGQWMQEGAARASPSDAAHAVTGTNVNGWRFWKGRLPGESQWRTLESFR